MGLGPQHVGLIPDGLRRWADNHDTTLVQAYQRGAHKVVELLIALQNHDVGTVTVYNLSRHNLGRRDDELAAVYQASVHFLATLIPGHFDAATCSFRLYGDRKLLPDNYVTAAHDLEVAMTGTQFRINLLAAYDANDELREAHQRARRADSDICSELEIDDIDLVIRTTPEPLLSGFPPMQCQYAQLLFLHTPLNELTAQHIDDIIAQYRRLPQLRGK